MARRQGERIDEPPEPPREIRPPSREFSVAPTSNGTILDFTDRNDFRTYENGIKEFYDKFDIDPSNLNSFIVAFANKSQRTGWSSIMEIPRDLQDPTAGTDNLLEKYGIISLERVKAWAQRILSEQSRRAQDDNMMYHSLVASLSNEGRAKLYLRSEDTTIHTETNGKLQSGLVAFKMITQEAGLRTQAKVVHLKMRLTKLSTLLATHTYNIRTFNEEVKSIVLELARMNEKANDLILYLFPAYMEAPDDDFKSYIRSLKDKYTEEGMEMSSTSLMDKAAHKYQNLVDSGTWKAPSENEKKLLALTTKIKELTSKSKKRKEREENKNDRRGGRSGKGKGDKSKRKDRDEDKWKAQNPENLKSKEVKGKVYHWCSVENGAPEGCGCNKFVLHKPETCKGKAWKSDLDSKKAAKRGKALKVQEALTRASNDIGDELYDSE
jgi:hypothetical protein